MKGQGVWRIVTASPVLSRRDSCAAAAVPQRSRRLALVSGVPSARVASHSVELGQPDGYSWTPPDRWRRPRPARRHPDTKTLYLASTASPHGRRLARSCTLRHGRERQSFHEFPPEHATVGGCAPAVAWTDVGFGGAGAHAIEKQNHHELQQTHVQTSGVSPRCPSSAST